MPDDAGIVTAGAGVPPAGAKLCRGVWLPASDAHFAAALVAPVKPHKRPMIAGKPAFGYHRIDAALKLTPDRRLFVDVGAHVGWWSIWLARHFARTIAFEPIRLHAELLARNLFDDRREHVTIHTVALGDRIGDVIMAVPPAHTGRAHIVPDRGPGTVPLRRLDDYALSGLDLLKIDVEGYERRVLVGGAETIRRDRPVIVIEQLGHETRYGEPPDSALALLRSWGYRDLCPPMKGDHFLGPCGDPA